MRGIRRFLFEYRTMILSAVALAGSIMGVVIVVIPAIRQTVDVWKKGNDLQIEVTDLRSKTAVLGSLDEEELRDQLTTLLSAVPSDKSVSTVFATVETLAGQSGITLSDMTVTGIGSV